jgi:hypothetical protein
MKLRFEPRQPLCRASVLDFEINSVVLQSCILTSHKRILLGSPGLEDFSFTGPNNNDHCCGRHCAKWFVNIFANLHSILWSITLILQMSAKAVRTRWTCLGPYAINV